MKIKAEIIKDSIGPSGKRITTFVLTYPRYIHSELMTHRMISKNSASSRAIPTKKMRRMALFDIAMPRKFTKNRPGMTANEELSGLKNLLAKGIWRFSGLVAVFSNFLLEKLGAHKQHANRILEPYLMHTIVATATDWDNFFALRMHPAAQPELNSLAVAMAYEYETKRSKAQILKDGEWHLPFVHSKEGTEENLIQSVACCARVSYLNHDKSVPNFEDHKRLYDKLLGEQPIHASPAEHQAKAVSDPFLRSGNFTGWIQYRKTIQGENISDMHSFWASQRKQSKP